MRYILFIFLGLSILTSCATVNEISRRSNLTEEEKAQESNLKKQKDLAEKEVEKQKQEKEKLAEQQKSEQEALIKAEAAKLKCSSSGMFEQGFNEARKGKDMQSALAVKDCDSKNQESLALDYRKGFLSGLDKSVNIKTVEANVGVISAQFKKECKEAYGKKKCGYNCIQSYGNVYCAKKPENQCIESYGKVKCGFQCEAKYGKIECVEED